MYTSMTFLNAPLHSLKLKLSNLTMDVIGSCKTQSLPPVIILQLGKLAPFTADHILTPFGHYIKPCTAFLWAFYITWSVLKTSFCVE